LAVLAWLCIRNRQNLIGAAIGAAVCILGYPLTSITGFPWPLIVAGIALLVAMGWRWHPWPVGAVFCALTATFFITPNALLGLAPYWLFALGSLFVAVTLLLPSGLVGTVQEWWARREAFRGAKAAAIERTQSAPNPAE
jgi:ABC-type branched-subunit amino acid transport system permease subunit